MFRFVQSVVLCGLLAWPLLSQAKNTHEILSAEACFKASGERFSEVLACYKKTEASKALSYTVNAVQHFPGIEKRSFNLISQNWSPYGLVKPAQWKHDVEVYIPTNALPGQALLIANNGVNYPDGENGVKAASDIDEAMAQSIAKQTRTIVVSINNLPNQYLTYSDDNVARREDDSVAHSWKLFLADPEQRPFIPLHIPMAQAMIKAMDLAQKELQPWQINRFIVTGVSKRAWSAWLATVADDRIHAVVPFVIDVLNMQAVLQHTYRVYGKSWPLALGAYQREGITEQLQTEHFGKLLHIEDPLRYLDTAHAKRLSIPKYIVNAGSDEFFAPDNARFYLDQLPGQKALRVIANSGHYGIREFVTESLIPVINRLQHGKALPAITSTAVQNKIGNEILSLHFSEAPIALKQWTATNPLARDFRYPCGVRYQPTAIVMTDALSARLTLGVPDKGWSATFIEATFADGLIATTPVYVAPNTYPAQRPPVVEPFCKTLDTAS